MNKETRNMTEKQVAKKQNSSVALASMFEADSSTGLDNMGAEDLALPSAVPGAFIWLIPGSVWPFILKPPFFDFLSMLFFFSAFTVITTVGFY